VELAASRGEDVATVEMADKREGEGMTTELESELIAGLRADGRALRNGKRGDIAAMSEALGRACGVLAVLAERDTPTRAECEAKHAQFAPGTFLRFGRVEMSSKSGWAVVGCVVALAAAWIGGKWIERMPDSEARIRRVSSELITQQVADAKQQAAGLLQKIKK